MEVNVICCMFLMSPTSVSYRNSARKSEYMTYKYTEKWNVSETLTLLPVRLAVHFVWPLSQRQALTAVSPPPPEH